MLILDGARALAKKEKLTLVEDEALLAENAGLTEWPVALMGSFDEAFLEVPPEVLATVDEGAPEMLLRRLMLRDAACAAPQHEDKRRAHDPHPEEALRRPSRR